MRLSLLIADFAYAGKQRLCLFEGPTRTSTSQSRGIVGRNPSTCRMVVEDPSVSRQHFDVLFVDDKFWVRNLSANGTLVVGKSELRDKGAKSALDNNDRIQIGDTELLATILPTTSTTQAGMAVAPLPSTTGSAPQTTHDQSGSSAGAASLAHPTRKTDFVRSVGSRDELQRPTEVKLPPAAGPASRNYHIPDDLDLEALLGLKPGATPEPAQPSDRRGRGSPGVELEPPAPRAPARASVKPRAAIAPGAPEEDGVIGRILAASGIEPKRAEELAAVLDAEAMGHLLGASITAITSLLMLRDSFKRMFRLSSTEVKTTGNNPLKLLGAESEILAELLNPPPGFLRGADAVRDATLELQIHQAAIAQCIGTTFESLIDFLDPATSESASEGSFLANLAGGRDVAAWRAYREMFEKNFGDRRRAFLTIYLERFGQDYESNTNKAKSASGNKGDDRKRKRKP